MDHVDHLRSLTQQGNTCMEYGECCGMQQNDLQCFTLYENVIKTSLCMLPFCETRQNYDGLHKLIDSAW